jgi:hypothetical protein
MIYLNIPATTPNSQIVFGRICVQEGVTPGEYTDYESYYTNITTKNYSSYALPISGGTLTGALNLANGTWNKAGDDCYFGDDNIAGTFLLKGINGHTALGFKAYNSESVAKMVYDGTAIWYTSHSVFEAGLTAGS